MDALNNSYSEQISVVTADGGVQSPPAGEGKPFLKVFGPDIGVVETELSEATVSIGRADTSDMLLPDQRVSRAHARIVFDKGEHVLEDVGSTSGTTVNRKTIKSHVLRHGDRAKIGPYVLQFRTHQEIPGAAAAAAKAQLLMRSKFSVLPSGISLRYRTLAVVPAEIFETGDTLRIGQSGLLVPVKAPPGDCICLEVQLTWSGGKQVQYLGEVVGVLEDASIHWMCVKLHAASKEIYQATLTAGEPGEWSDSITS